MSMLSISNSSYEITVSTWPNVSLFHDERWDLMPLSFVYNAAEGFTLGYQWLIFETKSGWSSQHFTT